MLENTRTSAIRIRLGLSEVKDDLLFFRNLSVFVNSFLLKDVSVFQFCFQTILALFLSRAGFSTSLKDPPQPPTIFFWEIFWPRESTLHFRRLSCARATISDLWKIYVVTGVHPHFCLQTTLCSLESLSA